MIFLAFLLGVSMGEGDRDLVERLKRRDPNAMADLYDRFGRIVYSVIFTIVRDTGIAEDLLQESFLRVWNRVGAFDSERGALGPWLLTVARNRAIDHIRSSGARFTRNTFEIEEREHPSLFADAEQDMLTADQARVIRNALAALNPNEKRVIQLAYYEGLSQTEMAERMAEPLGTVKTWARSALKKLRAELERG
ncbi:MAG: sigma-70 family RNA polymerase sigma factor [Acidobacteriota bacterium]|nr:sigma-70 family RNA polymerase sigma factor [Acidobacteriota bacterium]